MSCTFIEGESDMGRVLAIDFNFPYRISFGPQVETILYAVAGIQRNIV